jgi:putative serine protease PepD
MKSSSATAPSLASTSNATALETLQESVAAKVKPSIVEVYVALPHNQAAIGSGVIVDSRGYIVANNHVVSEALTIQVMRFNETKEAA